MLNAWSLSVRFLIIFLFCFLVQAVLLRSKKMNLCFLALFLVICIQYLPVFIAMSTLEGAKGMQSLCAAITNSPADLQNDLKNLTDMMQIPHRLYY